MKFSFFKRREPQNYFFVSQERTKVTPTLLTDRGHGLILVDAPMFSLNRLTNRGYDLTVVDDSYISRLSAGERSNCSNGKNHIVVMSKDFERDDDNEK